MLPSQHCVRMRREHLWICHKSGLIHDQRDPFWQLGLLLMIASYPAAITRVVVGSSVDVHCVGRNGVAAVGKFYARVGWRSVCLTAHIGTLVMMTTPI